MQWNITADRPVYVQLIEQMEQMLAAGQFQAGQRLPGVRELAAQAGVNPNTMQRALAELETRGPLVTQRTAGRSVTEDEKRIADLKTQLAGQRAQDFLQAMRQLGYSGEETVRLLQAAAQKEEQG